MDGQEALQALRQSPPTSTTLSDEAQISRPNKSVSSYSPNILMPYKHFKIIRKGGGMFEVF